MWKFIKSRKCDNVGVAPLNDRNELYTDNRDKANILNRQFCSVFTRENEKSTSASDSANYLECATSQ